MKPDFPELGRDLVNEDADPADDEGHGTAVAGVIAARTNNLEGQAGIYPAAYGDVISVAGTTSSDSRYSWSNFGSRVDVSAPGCNTAPAAGGGYIEFCGTSSAAPVVIGIAGLALSVAPEASAAVVEQAIAGGATPLPGVARYGRVNAPIVISTVAQLGTSIPVEAPTSPPATTTRPASPAPAAQPAAPVNVEPPRLRGRARVGRTLRVVSGTWQPAPLRFAYQWQRCTRTGAQCRTIAHARLSRYRLRRIDRGQRIQADGFPRTHSLRGDVRERRQSRHGRCGDEFSGPGRFTPETPKRTAREDGRGSARLAQRLGRERRNRSCLRDGRVPGLERLRTGGRRRLPDVFAHRARPLPARSLLPPTARPDSDGRDADFPLRRHDEY